MWVIIDLPSLVAATSTYFKLSQTAIQPPTPTQPPTSPLTPL